MIDYIIFIGFLLINIIFVLLSSRGIKTVKEFAIGNKVFSMITISSTLIASYLSASGFFIQLTKYNFALYNQYVMWLFIGGIVASFLSIALLCAPRMKEFLDKISIADAMGSMFGIEARIITSIAGFLSGFVFLAIQLKLAGTLFQYGLAVSFNEGVIIVGSIITLYTSLGGIKSVTFNYRIKFFTFGFIIFTVICFIIALKNDYQAMFTIFEQDPLYSYKEVLSLDRLQLFEYICVFFILAIPSFNSIYFQRIAMARNNYQVKFSHIIACCFSVFAFAIAGFIILSIKAKNPNLQGEEVFRYIFTNYLHSGLRSFTLVTIIAIVMSTGASYINTISVLVVHDFCKPLKLTNFITNELLATRIITVISGFIGITLAIKLGSLTELFILANTFFMPIVSPIFIMAIFGFRPNKICVLTGMFSGFLITLFCEYFLKHLGIASLLPGILFNFSSLILSHYILKLPGGWIDIEVFAEKDSMQDKYIRDLSDKICNTKTYIFFKANGPKEDKNYLILGGICIAFVFVNIFTLTTELNTIYRPAIIFIHVSVIYVGSLLLCYPLWERLLTNKVAISVLWNLIIFYVLVCVSFFLTLISDFSLIQLIPFILSSITLMFIVRWRVALWMLIIGILITTINFQLFVCDNILNSFTEGRVQAIYISLLLSSLLIIYLKPNHKYLELAKNKLSFLNDIFYFKNRELQIAGNIEDELEDRIYDNDDNPQGIFSMAKKLYKNSKQLTDSERHETIKNIYQTATIIDMFQRNLETLYRLGQPGYDLNKATFNIAELLNDRIVFCKKIYDSNESVLNLNIEDHIIVHADKYHMTQVLDNLIVNSITYCKAGQINISLNLDTEFVEFTIIDDGVSTQENQRQDVFNKFLKSTNSSIPIEERVTALVVYKIVIQLHGGRIFAETEDSKSVFKFTLPTNIK